MNYELTCVIVDDEPLAVKIIESFVQRTEGLTLLGSYTDSVEAIAAIKARPADLLFLDIQMPDLDGMELARMIPSETRVIFTTAFKEYAFESYEVSALDFLLKPIRYNKFLAAVEKARAWFDCQQPSAPRPSEPAPTSMFIRVDGELRQVQFSDIVYVSGMKDYVMFYLQGERRPLITHMTMKSVEELLPADKFLRVHRSFIVALDKIRKVDRNDCIYIGEEVIHVTEAYIEAFHRYLDSRMV